MENHCEALSNGEATDSGLQIVKYTPFQPFAKLSSSWFDLRVFYVRISNFQVDDSTPEFLTLKHIPLSQDTILKVSGARNGVYCSGFSSLLRRDRVDKKSLETTFVSTESIRFAGSVRFEVFDKDDLILSGVLENGFDGKSNNKLKHWIMNCESKVTAGSGFLKGKCITGLELPSPTIEVYVAGCFSGKPVILTKTLKRGFQKKDNKKGMLDAISEYETQGQKNVSPGYDMQIVDYRSYNLEKGEEYSNMYWRRKEYVDNEDGELSWFNAGVRVGVGLGLGICLGIGIGVGLLVRSYRTTTRNLKKRLA